MIPWVREIYRRHAGSDLAVIGIHYPEFAYERELDNVRDATERLDVPYPVVIDNNAAMWRAYGQRAWPTRYLLDKRGHIRYRHIGEGAYDESEKIIRTLLAEPDL